MPRPYKRRRKSNPINWQRQADWFEGEGSKRTPPKRGRPFKALTTVTQSMKRADVVKALCNELRQAGFTATTRQVKKPPRTNLVCDISRVEEQKCFIERVRPYFIGAGTQKWADQYLKAIEQKKKMGPPRIPFKCPSKEGKQKKRESS